MPHAIRYLAVVTCALAAVAGCGGGEPYFSLAWDVAPTVTLLPGEAVALPITVRREASVPSETRITFENAPEGVTLTPPDFSIPEGQDSVSVTPTLAVAADTAMQPQSVSQLLLVARDTPNQATFGVRVSLALLAPPAPQPDFSLAVEPRQLDVNAGLVRPVTVTVTRTAGFTGPLALTLESSSRNVLAEPLTLAGDQTTGTFNIRVEANVARAPVTTRLVATSEDGRRATTGLTIHIR